MNNEIKNNLINASPPFTPPNSTFSSSKNQLISKRFAQPLVKKRESVEYRVISDQTNKVWTPYEQIAI